MQATRAKIEPAHLCRGCVGNGFQPADRLEIENCPDCNGTGYATATGDLGPTHSEKKRPYRYDPACRKLTLGSGKKASKYTVGEFTPDRDFSTSPARAFQLMKEDGEVYSVLISRDGCTCDCAGTTYAASDKANQRARAEGREQYETLGCKHMDAVNTLLKAGWLDLPEGSVPPDLSCESIPANEPAPRVEPCGYCMGSGTVDGPTCDNHGYEITQRTYVCEYCGGSGQCEDGHKLYPHRSRGF